MGLPAGDFFLQSLGSVKNAIAAVELRDHYDVGAEDNQDVYEIFVYTESISNEQRLVEVTGGAGNCYSDAGFKLLVTA